MITLVSYIGGEGKWEHAPRGAGLGDASTHFIQTCKNRVFQQKFRPNYGYKRVVFRKKLENRRNVGGPNPEPPLASGG